MPPFSKQCLLEATNLTFYKTRQLATWLQVSLKCQTGFQTYSSKKNEIKILIIQDSDLKLGTQKYFQFSVYTPSWGSHTPHFDRKLSQSSLPSSLKLKLSGTLWGSGVQICSVFSLFYLQDIDFVQPPWPSLNSKAWIQTIANQGREGIQKQKQSKVGTASRQSPGSYSKKYA